MLAVGGTCIGVPHIAARSENAASPFDRGGWMIGCYTRPWAKHDYRVAFDAIAEAGFKYIGLTGAKTETGRVIASAATPEWARQVGEEAEKRGLQIPIAYGGQIAAWKSLQAGIDDLRKMIDNCQIAGVWAVQMTSLGSAKLYDRYCKVVAECCDYAAEKDIALVLKPHGGMVGTGPQLRKAIRRVGHKNFRVWYDPGNIYYYSDGKINPVEDVDAVAGLVIGVCVKDYKHPKQVAVTPGTGQVDFRALLARLKLGGFTRGPMIIETIATGTPDYTLEQAKQARRYIEELVGRPMT